ncbi:MAG: protein kinase domain-containing protein, partial [Planctomycetota bacterium]
MREPPPPELIALVERLGLATADDVGRMGRRVRRLARDLPRFESVWVDALAQARVLTPFQAAEINAGRGELLRVGPYLLCGPLRRPDYVAGYRARRVDSGRIVRLVVAERPGDRSEEILARLEHLAATSGELRCAQLAPITEVGVQGDRIWAASPWVEGRSAAEWMVHNGRFPPEVVLEIARAMLAGLVVLEKAGFCHGDVSAASVMLSDAGGVVLVQPGLRAILRPEEGYARADLLPEAFDYLAPERVADGTPPTIAGDVYACGCVWWHMLCGRPPLSGGNSLGKLRAAQAAKVFDVRRLAPEVPKPL